MRLIDADALAEEISRDMKKGFPANENLSLFAISCIAHSPTVCDLGQLRDKIEEELTDYILYEPNKEIAARMFKVMDKALQIIDRHIAE